MRTSTAVLGAGIVAGLAVVAVLLARQRNIRTVVPSPGASELANELGGGTAPASPSANPSSCPTGVDLCGVCGGNGSSCTDRGCMPGVRKDICGVCGGDGFSCTSPGCTAGQLKDLCGVCGGDGLSCRDAECAVAYQRVNRCGDCTVGGTTPLVCPATGCRPGFDTDNGCGECWPSGSVPNVCSDGCPPGFRMDMACRECVPDGSPAPAMCTSTGCPPPAPDVTKNRCGDCALGGVTPAVCPATGCPAGQSKSNSCGECWPEGQIKPVCDNGCRAETPRWDEGCKTCVAANVPPLQICPDTGCAPGLVPDNCGVCVPKERLPDPRICFDTGCPKGQTKDDCGVCQTTGAFAPGTCLATGCPRGQVRNGCRTAGFPQGQCVDPSDPTYARNQCLNGCPYATPRRSDCRWPDPLGQCVPESYADPSVCLNGCPAANPARNRCVLPGNPPGGLGECVPPSSADSSACTNGCTADRPYWVSSACLDTPCSAKPGVCANGCPPDRPFRNAPGCGPGRDGCEAQKAPAEGQCANGCAPGYSKNHEACGEPNGGGECVVNASFDFQTCLNGCKYTSPHKDFCGVCGGLVKTLNGTCANGCPPLQIPVKFFSPTVPCTDGTMCVDKDGDRKCLNGCAPGEYKLTGCLEGPSEQCSTDPTMCANKCPPGTRRLTNCKDVVDPNSVPCTPLTNTKCPNGCDPFKYKLGCTSGDPCSTDPNKCANDCPPGLWPVPNCKNVWPSFQCTSTKDTCPNGCKSNEYKLDCTSGDKCSYYTDKCGNGCPPYTYPMTDCSTLTADHQFECGNLPNTCLNSGCPNGQLMDGCNKCQTDLAWVRANPGICKATGCSGYSTKDKCGVCGGNNICRFLWGPVAGSATSGALTYLLLGTFPTNGTITYIRMSLEITNNRADQWPCSTAELHVMRGTGSIASRVYSIRGGYPYGTYYSDTIDLAQAPNPFVSISVLQGDTVQLILGSSGSCGAWARNATVDVSFTPS